MNLMTPLFFCILTTLLSACTFGEGPEFEPEKFAVADVIEDAVLDVLVGEINTVDNEVQLPTTVPAVNDAEQESVQTFEQGPKQTQEQTQEQTAEQIAEQAPEQTPEAATIDQPMLVRIPATDASNAPKINGERIDYIDGTDLLDGEWRFAVQSDSLGEPLDIANRMFGDQSQASGRHHWAAMHDGVYLYLLVVSDDAGKHFQDTNELRKPWKDDSIEIFIDGNRSRLEQYDGVDDFHMTLNLLSSENIANASYGAEPRIRQSDFSATLPSDLSFATGLENGPMSGSFVQRKDIYEVRIKLSELNIVLEQPFGIEIQINDDDNGGNRDTKWGWHHPPGSNADNDRTWQTPRVMGQAVLVR